MGAPCETIKPWISGLALGKRRKMNRPMLLALLEAAKHKLAEIEVRIRHLLGAMRRG